MQEPALPVVFVCPAVLPPAAVSDFADRLDQAIARGSRQRQASEQQQQAAEFSRDQARDRHGEARHVITERIEAVLNALADRLPGFEYEGVYAVTGWGGAIFRNDIALGRDRTSRDLYSRLQISVSPIGEQPPFILETVCKGTVRNRELLNRKHFERLDKAEDADFVEKVDQWAVEFAELYSKG